MLPALACFMVAEKAFLSRRQHRFLFACAVLFPLTNLLLNRFLSRSMGVSGVALATTLTMALWFVVLLGRLLARVPVGDRTQLGRSLATTTAIALLTLVAAHTVGGQLSVVWWARMAFLGSLTMVLFSALLWLTWRRRLVVLFRSLTETRVGQ
jgi:peptidoglycan biosynthesis protein MviN/MurJ (putative lipid II flippase)